MCRCRRRCLDTSQSFFFFNDTATTEIYTLSLHDALPILIPFLRAPNADLNMTLAMALLTFTVVQVLGIRAHGVGGRKSTRLNSSHANISYAVFCLKKKKNKAIRNIQHEIAIPYH